MKTRIDWLSVGREHWEGVQHEYQRICSNVHWQLLPCKTSFAAGYAIKEAIKQFSLPKVLAVSESSELAPFGLIGIRASYKDCLIEVFMVDEGTHCTPVLVFVYQE